LSLCSQDVILYEGQESIADGTRERVNDKIIISAQIGAVDIPNPNDVDLRARNFISIEKDFETVLGATVLLDTESCIMITEQEPPPAFNSNQVDLKKKSKTDQKPRVKGQEIGRGLIRSNVIIKKPVSKK